MWNEMSLNKTLQLPQSQQQHQHRERKALASFTFNSIFSQCKNFNNNNNNNENVLTQYSVQYYFLTSRDDEFRHLWEDWKTNNKWIFFSCYFCSCTHVIIKNPTTTIHTNNTLNETKNRSSITLQRKKKREEAKQK